MIRGIGNILIAFVVAALLDKYLYANHYAGAALAMLRRIGHSLGW